MVGSEEVGKSLGAAQGAAGDAAQALTAILQTQYLRYLIIASWAVGLLATVGWVEASVWFCGTVAAGAVRGAFERRMAHKVTAGWGLVFPAIATVTTAAWASAPLLAWFSGHAFGHSLAAALLIGGYVLVFSQLRSSPKQAIVISSPYSVVAVIILASAWGTPNFWPFLAIMPFTAAGLFVLVTMTMLREERIKAFQEHQAHLIEELQAARDKADAANQAKSSFLGVISHELRTPMNGVLGAAQLLSATRLEATQREYLSIIRNSGDNLLSLLNDILDMTKIEAGKMTFEVIDVSFEDLHRRVTGPFIAQAEAKGLEFRSTFEGEPPAVVRGDPLRVCQVIQNLLSNAVKFTPDGGRVQVSADVADGDAMDLIVEDTGVGIPLEDQDSIFEKFRQGNTTPGSRTNSLTREFAGTGLGLSIVRELTKLLGGEVSLVSELGKGSRFTVRLPRSLPDENRLSADLLSNVGETSRAPLGERVTPVPRAATSGDI